MFGLHPSAPTRAEDYASGRAGRPLRNIRVRPRGLTPRRLAQLAGVDLRGVQHVTPDPWVPEPAIALSDVIAGPEPWMGMLLDPARPQPVPIGSLVRSAGPAPARHWLVWPDARLRPAHRLAGTDPRSVAAYLDEPAMAHFARELDEAAAEAAIAEQGDGPLDDRGVSLHVSGVRDGEALEHLRFDCFDEAPHYHYVSWKDRSNVMLHLDPIADGDALQWTLERLRTRLPQMLEHAGAADIAAQLDQRQIDAVLPRVAEAAYRARYHHDDNAILADALNPA